ncbi:hypothetical protein NMY22_g18048 [Coprinellus aureogranulatus]|nr:hypothetical protein NMY22_g18048 [Coprinellus aureogranulatus]
MASPNLWADLRLSTREIRPICIQAPPKPIMLWVMVPEKGYGVWGTMGLWVMASISLSTASVDPKTYGFPRVMGSHRSPFPAFACIRSVGFIVLGGEHGMGALAEWEIREAGATCVALWFSTAVPAIVLRKLFLTGKRTAAASPQKSFAEALAKPSTRTALATYALSAVALAFLHSIQSDDKAKLTIFVKSKKHPQYLNGRFLFIVITQVLGAATYVFRNHARYSPSSAPSSSQHSTNSPSSLYSFAHSPHTSSEDHTHFRCHSSTCFSPTVIRKLLRPSVSASSTSSSTTSVTPAASTTVTTTTSAPTATPRRRQLVVEYGGLSSSVSPQTPFPSRDFDMHISRPASAQMFILLMFALSWVLVHISVCMVFLARRPRYSTSHAGKGDSKFSLTSAWIQDGRAAMTGATKQIAYTFLCVGTLGAILGMRKSMADAPGLDGILLDCIGFFPQVIVTGICILVLLLTVAERDIDGVHTLPEFATHITDLEAHPHPYASTHCHCPGKVEQGQHQGERRIRISPSDHRVTDSEGTDSSAATNTADGIQYARRPVSHDCRKSLISAFPPPPGFRRSQSLSSPFSPTTSSGPGSPTSPTLLCGQVPLVSQTHVCNSSNGSSSASSGNAVDLGHWQFPSSSTHSLHSLPVSPTRFDVGRSRVMSPSPKIPRSPLVPLSPIGSGSPASTNSPTSPTASNGKRRKFTFNALGSVFGSPSPPASPNTRLGFPSLSKKTSPPRKSSNASLGALKRSGSAARNGGDVELEMRRDAKRRECGVGHRRVRTASVVREGSGADGEEGEKEEEREVSRWSDHEDDD